MADVEPVQEAAMAAIEERMLADVDRFSPEALFKTWLLPMAALCADRLQDTLRQGKE